MPYANPEIGKMLRRNHLRSLRLPSWRQVYINCGGMCNFILPDGSLCGSAQMLEFHEQFGEDHNGDGRMSQRVLMCSKHHNDMHPERYNVEHNPNHSMLTEDIEMDMQRLGGYTKWIEKYGLDDSTAGSLLPR
jgi:hypothetical protein